MEEGMMMFRTAEALDTMMGLEAAVTHRRFLAEYSHAEIAAELEITEQESIALAAAGLKRIKDHVFKV